MFKATFNITIEHFLNYRSLSNMPVNNTKTQGNMILTYFDKTPAISTYAVAIVLMRLIVVSTVESMWYYKKRSPYIKSLRYVIDNVKEHMKPKEWKNPNINTIKVVISPKYPYESREYFRVIIYRYYTSYLM